MFLFLRLLLGHLIGDFPFQTDEVYKGKVAGMPGQIRHGLIIGIAIALMALPYLHIPVMWGLIALFVALHILIDWMKLRYLSRRIPIFWGFILDQALHVASLLPVLFFDFSRAVPMGKGQIYLAYNDNSLVVLAIGFLAATFSGTYFLGTLKLNYFAKRATAAIPRSINYGLLERGIFFAATCFWQSCAYPVVAAFVIMDSFMRCRSRAFDLGLNIIYAGAIGFIVRGFIH